LIIYLYKPRLNTINNIGIVQGTWYVDYIILKIYNLK